VILRSSVALTLTSRPEPAGSPTLQCHGRRRGGSGAAVRRYRAPMQTTRLRITMRDVEPEVVRVIDVPAAVTLGCGPGRRSSTRRAHTRPGTPGSSTSGVGWRAADAPRHRSGPPGRPRRRDLALPA